MSIGGRIRAARKAAGLSQEELARRADLSLNGFADIEREVIKDPHYSSLRKIADALGVPIGELLEAEPVPFDEASEAGQSAAEAKPETVSLEGLVRTYKTVARIGREVARSFTDFKEADLQRLADFHELSANLASLRKRDILGRNPEKLAEAVEELDEAQDAVQVALQEHVALAQPEKLPILLRAAELVGVR